MSDHKSLKVWHKSMNLVEEVYNVTRQFPDTEKYGLVNQIRRAAVSIPSNIAEDCGRKTDKEFVHFLRIAFGSSSELETQLILSQRLNYLSPKDFKQTEQTLTEVRMMLNKLISNTLSANN